MVALLLALSACSTRVTITVGQRGASVDADTVGTSVHASCESDKQYILVPMPIRISAIVEKP